MSNRYAPIDPVFRIPDVKVDSEFLVNRGIGKFEAFEADRSQWVERREEFYLGWDDYLSDTRKGLWDGASNFHLPTTEIQCNVMHARILQSIFFIEPIFFIDPQDDVDADRILKIESFMKYIITRGSNYNRGIYNAIDDWAWDLTTDGMAILKRDWVIDQRRFIDIEQNDMLANARLDLDSILKGEMRQEDFERISKEFSLQKFMEVPKIRTVFNGSVVEAVDPSYVLFKGMVADATDLNRMETVIEVCHYTREQLESFRDGEFMDEDVVNEILSRPPDIDGSSYATQRYTGLRGMQDELTGVRTINPSTTEDRYEFIKVYDTTKLTPKSKFRDRVVYHVHPNSNSLARWTFMDRISATGNIPLHMGHLYRRPRRSTGRGMVETQMPFAELTDILVNQSVDAGLYANNPMLKSRSGGAFDAGEFRIEPGLIVQTDNPAEDLIPINFNVNPSWSFGLMNFIQSYATQLTSLGPQSTGQVAGRVGPMRSTSGLNAMLSQSDIQLDVIIRRVKQPISELFEGLYMDNVQRMPNSMKLTLTNGDSTPIIDDETGLPMKLEVTRDDLRTRVNFGLYANSANMNKIAQEQKAMQLIQTLVQPVALQTGIVGAEELYNLYDNLLVSGQVQNRHRFVKKPQNLKPIPYEMELLSIIQGVKPQISPMDPEHEKKAQALSELIGSDAAMLEIQYGQVHPEALKLAKIVMEEHLKLAEMMQSPQRIGNPTGSNVAMSQERVTGEGADVAMPEAADGVDPAMNPEAAGNQEGGAGE